MRLKALNTVALLLAPAVIAVAGCGGHVSAFGTNSKSLKIHAAEARIDTAGSIRYTATLTNGEPAKVAWSVSGGDPSAGAGVIRADGLYTPPGYLTRDAVTVSVNAVLADNPEEANPPADSAVLTVTPGFLQPLTPGNLTLGPNGTATISGSMTEVGGSEGIRFSLASDTAGTPLTEGASGTLSSPRCVRNSITGSNPAYTVCSVTYMAPAAIPAAASVFVMGAVASSRTLSWTRIQLNAAAINSNPVEHQAHLQVPVQLGSSSGNNSDYDASLGQLSDCCGGTLGALLEDSNGDQYVLSNNHILARSDQSIPGETIIQPGLIDNGCTPYGVGPGTTPVATLTGFPALSSAATNVDAAIARVTPGAVDPKGNILELGARQQDGTLAAAAPGISSSGGKGETASLGMMVAKSGRTTGLTCAAVSAINVDVTVEYFTDCAETAHSMTKTFTNQIAIAGTSFSDAGDSGALVVDSANAEPVGLFFAGGTDANGVEHAIANPAADVLAALDAQVPGSSGQASYSFVGGADHPVSCLNYGGVKTQDDAAALNALPAAVRERAESALPAAELLVNPGANSGVARVGLAASKDHPGEAAVALYAEPGATGFPPSIGGVSTVILPSSGQTSDSAQPRAASLAQVLAAKQRNSATLLKSNAAIFGVGVGQSLDNPNEAALVLFVDRKKVSGKLPDLVEGQRVRVILMDRLHVTRSHGSALNRSAVHAPGNCLSPRSSSSSAEDGNETAPDLFRENIQLPD